MGGFGSRGMVPRSAEVSGSAQSQYMRYSQFWAPRFDPRYRQPMRSRSGSRREGECDSQPESEISCHSVPGNNGTSQSVLATHRCVQWAVSSSSRHSIHILCTDILPCDYTIRQNLQREGWHWKNVAIGCLPTPLECVVHLVHFDDVRLLLFN